MACRKCGGKMPTCKGGCDRPTKMTPGPIYEPKADPKKKRGGPLAKGNRFANAKNAFSTVTPGPVGFPCLCVAAPAACALRCQQ